MESPVKTKARVESATRQHSDHRINRMEKNRMAYRFRVMLRFSASFFHPVRFADGGNRVKTQNKGYR